MDIEYCNFQIRAENWTVNNTIRYEFLQENRFRKNFNIMNKMRMDLSSSIQFRCIYKFCSRDNEHILNVSVQKMSIVWVWVWVLF